MSTKILSSDETQVVLVPQKFAIAQPTKLITFIKGEPPSGAGRGRKRSAINSAIYNILIERRNEWAHLNVTIKTAKEKASLIASLYTRARKDNLYLSSRSLYNDTAKIWDVWVNLHS
jgi:hypothetical protein